VFSAALQLFARTPESRKDYPRRQFWQTACASDTDNAYWPRKGIDKAPKNIDRLRSELKT
jgi:hypothetical protein